MNTINIIENKISFAKDYLKILDGYKKHSMDEILNDLTLKGAVERYLYLAVQATVDLAKAAIAFKDFRKPTSQSEAFKILESEGFISKDLTEKLMKMTGFRNAIAHDYVKINFEIVYDTLQNNLPDIEEFIKQVKEKL